MTIEVLPRLKHRPTGGAATIASAALHPSTDSDVDDDASFFELAVHDGDGEAADSDSDRDFSLSVSPGGGVSLQSSLPSPSTSDDPFSKPGTKLRVLMLGFKKLVPPPASSPKRQRQSRFFANLKPDEAVPIATLFTRPGSGRATSPEERRPSRDGLQRYLSKIKPLYVRVSKYGRQLSSPKPDDSPSPAANRPQGGGLPAGLKGMSKRLVKSRSASAAVRSPPPPVLPRRRDDSLLEQQDGIQSAIAHCKRSFSAGRGEGSWSRPAIVNFAEPPESPLVRSRSDPGDERVASTGCFSAVTNHVEK